MRHVVVLSGKGGTGKTTVTAALAERIAARRPLVMVDADVDAANLGLLLRPERLERHEYEGGKTAVIDPEQCLSCGECQRSCRFDALRSDRYGTMRIDPIACEGCGACLDACPLEVIRLVPGPGGAWWRSATPLGALFHAELEPGEETTGRLVTTIRQAASKHAEALGSDLVLIDGPPGIACPAIAACSGVDLAVVVTEPSLQGAHDLERILDLLEHFEIPVLLCINRADLAPGRTLAIEEAAHERGLDPAVRIPFDEAVLRAVRAGRALGATESGPAADALTRLDHALDAALARGVRAVG